jgi:hypothetical protein
MQITKIRIKRILKYNIFGKTITIKIPVRLWRANFKDGTDWHISGTITTDSKDYKGRYTVTRTNKTYNNEGE